ncbi:MAG: carbohydrate kinase family protein [Candidatus Altiarchaeota archaeon]|nr:carbohydrate kinase family protein [Candidatus Altiarchaeota archaeon]
MMDVEVTSVGDINVDLVCSNLEDMPGRDSQVLVDDLFVSSGGCAANFAKAASRLGLGTRFIGKTANDIYGDFLRRELSGVDLRLATGSKTGVTYALTFRDGSRSFLTYPGSNREFEEGDVDLELVEGGFLHVASFFLQGLREKTKDLLVHAKGKGMVCSFDTGWDPRGWGEKDRELVIDVLEVVDIFFPNLREAEAITGLNDVDEVCDSLLDMGPKIIALKLGSEGSFIAGEERKFGVEPLQVDVVDSTGAGDVFAAGFIYGRCRGFSLEESGRFANAAAALSTRCMGSSCYPTEREVAGFIRNHRE